MAKQNRICHTCGNGYYYCPSCPNDKRDPQVYVMWCGERCKKIFGLLSDETFNRITTEECKNELLKLGVTKDDTFKDGVKAHAERVLNFVELVTEEVATAEINEVEKVYDAVEQVEVVEPTEVVEVVESVNVDEVVEPAKTETVDTVEVENIVLNETETHNTEYMAKHKKKKRYSEVN